MISDIFYSYAIDQGKKYKYEEDYVKYFIIKKINKSGSMDKYDLYNWLKNEYSLNINWSRFNLFVSKNFIEQENIVDISSLQTELIEKTKYFERVLFQLEWEKEEEIYKILNHDFLKYNDFDLSKAAIYVLTLKKAKLALTVDEILYTYFAFIYNLDNYFIKTDLAINSIDSTYYSIPINLLFRSAIVNKIFLLNGVNYVREISRLNVSFVLVAILADLDFSLSIIDSLGDDAENNLITKIKICFNSLKQREYEILSLRNGFESAQFTLEEIGKKYDLTRERVRQIESKATGKIIDNSIDMQNQIYAMFFSLAKIEKRYITVEAIKRYLKSELLTNYLLFVISIADFKVKFDPNLCVIYYVDLTSVDDLCKEVMDICGSFFSIADFNVLNQFEKSVVRLNYKLINDTIYVKKSFNTKELVGVILDEYFSEGYRIGCVDDYAKLKEKFEERFGVYDDFSSERSIVGFIDRLGFCQIDKGTYKNRANCVSLPEELIDKMINYVLMNGPTVFYTSIYSKFETELRELGVTNYYYLKGLLDPLFPHEFKTKRNYVSTSENFISSNDAILSFMRSFNGEFKLSDLKHKFEGVKDYTLYNAIYSEIENGLVWLSGKSFIYLNKVVITDEAKNEFKQFIDNMFSLLSTNAVSSRKIFARLSLTNRGLLQRLKIARDNFSTFSLIKSLYPNDYGFNRPIISKNKSEQITTYNLIVNYVMSLDSFNLKAINNYVSKMNIRGLYSYLAFMEDMSDEFVQVNIETMVKKSKINIDQKKLDEIQSLIELIIKRFGKLDTRQFNGYQMFPNMEYHWNKYLLVGIVRTYLSDRFTIDNTTNFYNDTDFIIGGNENE